MPFLTPLEKEKMEVMNKSYDIKKSCWVRDEKEGFVAGEIQAEDDDKVTVKIAVPHLLRCLWWTSSEHFIFYYLNVFLMLVFILGLAKVFICHFI